MAIVYYDKLYKRKGIRRLSHILSPRILDAKEFDFPIGSVVQWWKPTEHVEYLTKDYGYFTKTDKVQVESFFNYPEQTEGKFLSRSFMPNTYISDNAKKCKEFKFLKHGQSINVPDKTLKIANYGGLPGKYRYTTHYSKDYSVHRNTLATVVENMFKTNRKVFLLMDIPLTLFPRVDLDRMVKNLTPAFLQRFTNPSMFNVLELWRLLTPNNRQDAILSKIPASKLNLVDLILVVDNKLILINLNFLLACVKEYDLEHPFIKPSQAKSSIAFKKLFHKFLSKFITDQAMSEADLDLHDKYIEANGDKLESNIPDTDVEETTPIPDPEPQQPIEPIVEKTDTDNFVPTATGVMAVKSSKQEQQGDLLSRLRNVGFADNNATTPKEQEEEAIRKLEEEEEEEITRSLQEQEDEYEQLLDDQARLEEIQEDELEEEDKPTELDKAINKYEMEQPTEIIPISTLKQEDISFKDIITKKVNSLKESKVLSSQAAKKLLDSLAKQDTAKDPFNKDRTLKEVLDYSKDKIKINKEDTSITPNKVVLNEDYNNNITNMLRKDYLKDQYKKDLVRSIYSIQNYGVVIEDYNVTIQEDLLGKMEEHTITLRTIDGKTNTFKFLLPEITEDGTMCIRGQEYIMRFQRLTAILAKIDYNKVKMSTYYGTLFITKANYKKTDVGYKVMNQLSKRYIQGELTDLIAMPCDIEGIKLPLVYAQLARYINQFTYKDITFKFDYNKRYTTFPSLTKEEINKIEGKDKVLAGIYNNNPILIDNKNNLLLYNLKDKKYTTITDNLLEYLDLDLASLPIEFATLKIFKKPVPIVMLLTYYLGLNGLLGSLKAKYRTEDLTKRITDSHKYIVVKFKDTKLVIERDYDIGDMILGGLLEIEDKLKEVELNSLNNKNTLTVLFSKLDYSRLYINEIKNLETLYVDPMSVSLCKEVGLPTTFKGLVIKACELLLDDSYLSPSNITQMSIKGYERICGMVYNELVRAIKEYDNKSAYSKTKLSISPYAILTAITEDSTNVIIDDLNPIALLKQTEDVSYLGKFGFKSKESLARDSRIFNTSEVGIISEATKDSSQVGITAYMSAAPKIESVRGNVGSFNPKEDGLANVMSTSALLSPFGTTDDTKRLNFASIMNQHIVPIKNMRVPYVRTGYEAVIPIRAADKFVVTAEDNGTVTKVTKKDVTVNYKTAGTKTYKLKKWNSKVVGESCYTHELVSNVKEGDKFVKDDTLIYDKVFFEPDIFNPKRVVYKQGDMLTIALVEDPETYEDSATIHKDINSRLGTSLTKVKSIVVNHKDEILEFKPVGTNLEPSDVLFSITDNIIPMSNLDPETLKLIKELKTKSPKAKMRGTISRVEIRYNCEYKELSKTLKELVDISNQQFKEETGYEGRVTSNYSINGKGLQPGSVEIKIFIDSDVGMGIGDKMIIANQLKCTIGEVYENDLTTEDGTPIDCTFSYRSISARIVNSPILLGTTSMVLEQLGKKAVEMYFGK